MENTQQQTPKVIKCTWAGIMNTLCPCHEIHSLDFLSGLWKLSFFHWGTGEDSDEEKADILEKCDNAALCLGHSLSLGTKTDNATVKQASQFNGNNYTLEWQWHLAKRDRW